MALRVMLVSAVRLYREGLKQVLEREGRLKVVRMASGVEEVLEELPACRPDGLLLDVATPGALEAVRRMAALPQQVKIIALGLSDEERDVLPCAEAGIAGYVCREGSVDDLVRAVESAVKEEFHCSRRIAAALLRRVASLAEYRRRERVERLHLTPRERQIVSLLDEGLTNKEISSRLFIEVSTVKNHVHSILEKLQVRTRGEAAAKVRRVAVLAPTRTSLPYGSP